MILIQDVLEKEVEWTRSDIGLDLAKFKHSSVMEFVDEMSKLKTDIKYPFFFVNAGLIEYDLENPDDIIVTVGEIVIATKFISNASSERKDAEVFRPILTPFLEMFLYRLDYNRNIAIYKTGKIKYHYRYGSSDKEGTKKDALADPICAIQLTNFQFRILTPKN